MLKGDDFNVDKIGSDDALPDISALQREVLIDQIANKGSKAEAAALQADIGLRKFRKWMEENESFKIFIEELTLTFNNRLRRRVVDAIEHLADKDNDAAQVADKGIKMLERLDPSFGTKHTSLTIDEKPQLPNVSTKDDAEVQAVFKQAEEAANAHKTGS